ncbi:phospholipase A1 member A-like [Thrips palmi]|uniref:Phospholipase A1 member A-like n=1 Tax=Thrips palmi TaxID=161013 RepID=A0A6P8Z601_THRPL|nr:phospholipase A1 member A-like [Thrips palmi]
MGRLRLPLWMVLLLLPPPGSPYVQDLHAQDRGFGQLMAGQWRCMLDGLLSGRTLARVFAPSNAAAPPCYPDVTVHLYSGMGLHCRWPPRRKVLDPRRPGWLRWSGWDPRRRTVLLVHGFNGGAEKAPLSTLRDAYLEQGAFNVLALDWSPLARYPCYADAVRHSRTAAACGAQVLSALQATLASGLGVNALPAADTRLATCVGHSLGAHICGMLSRLLPLRLNKVVALDPARPQVSRLLGDEDLSASDARVVQSFHTNMGFYGEYPEPGVGLANFCFNGGRLQPNCDQGTRFARMRCSHFLSVCYYAQLVQDWGREAQGRRRTAAPTASAAWTTAVACDGSCNRVPGGPPLAVKLTETSIDRWRGTHCLDLRLDRPCRIDA